MRITDVFLQNGGMDAIRKNSNAQKPQNKATPNAPKAKDSFTVSDEGKNAASKAESSALEARVNALPDVRQDRIADVRSKIESGYYNTEEFKDKLADRLLNDLEF